MIILGFVVALLDLDILSPVDTHLSLICSDSLLERSSIHFSVLIQPVILFQRDDNDTADGVCLVCAEWDPTLNKSIKIQVEFWDELQIRSEQITISLFRQSVVPTRFQLIRPAENNASDSLRGGEVGSVSV